MAGNFEVLNVSPGIDIDSAGRPNRVIVVTFQTLPTKQGGELRVPADTFDVATVQPLLAAAAATIEAVRAL